MLRLVQVLIARWCVVVQDARASEVQDQGDDELVYGLADDHLPHDY